MARYTVSQKKNGFPVIYAAGYAWLSLECRDKADQIARAMNQHDPAEPVRERIVVEIGADISGLEEAMAAATKAGAGLADPQLRLQQLEARVATLSLRVHAMEARSTQPYSPWAHTRTI